MDHFKIKANSQEKGWDQHIWPPFTQIQSAIPQQKVVRGLDALLYREEGPPLIDAISSWWVTLHGHANPYVANAIAEQAKCLEQVIFADFIHPQAEQLAKRLSDVTGIQRLFFSDNGSTAVEVALKIACQYWYNRNEPKHQLIAFEGGYHGDTFGAMAVGERNLFNAPFEEMLFPVSRVPWPSTWWGDQNIEKKEEEAIARLEVLLETPTAAVILEPLVQGAGGMAMVRNEFLKKVEKVVREAKALLITDEVMTGFGRCGDLFASHRADISPDLMTLSKGLTSGFLPMGITMVGEEIFEQFIGQDPKLTFWHGHSFTGNPLGCAAANASLDLLEKDSFKYKEFESRHIPHLKELSKHSKISKVRVTGTIAAFDIKSTGASGYLNESGKSLKEYVLKHGVFIRPLGNVVYLLPPLCMTDSQLEKCYSIITQGLENL